MRSFHYRYGDGVVSSDVPLPSLPPAEGRPEIRVRLVHGASTRSTATWDHHWRLPDGSVSLSCARDGDVYRLGFPSRAVFKIDRDGSEVRCRPAADVPPETLEHLLVDQVLPRVSTLRGRLTLHAGAVAYGGRAIAFLGDSGAGKSTLCAACLRSGATLIGDDGIVVRSIRDGSAEIVATYPGLRLHPEPAARLLGANDGPRVAHDSEKRRARLAPETRQPGPAGWPLRAVYLLESGASERIALEGATAREGFMALTRATLHLHLQEPEAARALFETLARLVEVVPVRRLRYPRRYGSLAEVVRRVLEDETAA